MFDWFFGYILYIIGINKTPPSVRGDSTVSASLLKAKRLEIEKKMLSWDAKSIEYEKIASASYMTKHKAFETKLATVKDAKKKAILENVETNIQNVNTKRSQTMLKYLTDMSNILQKISVRIEESGRTDTADIYNAIAEAEKSIDTAVTAVSEQAQKAYSITISTESAAKADVDTARKTLETDLKAVHEKVTAARKSVENVINEVKLLGGLKPTVTSKPSQITQPTSTGKPSVSPTAGVTQ